MRKRKGLHAGTASRKRDIIRAALKSFSEIGFTITSMEDIRRQSGASTGSIYHHFKGKEQLAAAVYLEGIRDYQAGLMVLFRGDSDARTGIRSIVEYHLKWVEANQEWSRYLFRMRHSDLLVSAEGEIADMNRDLMKSAEGWFARHIRKGKIRKMPPDIIISIILGPCMEHTRQYLSGHAVTGIETTIRELTEAAWRALVPIREHGGPSSQGGEA